MAIKKDVKVIQLSLGDIKPYSNNPRKSNRTVIILERMTAPFHKSKRA